MPYSGLSSFLCPLTAPEPHSLAVLLQFGDKLVTLADNVLVLLVLVVWPVGLDDTLARHTVNGARDATPGNELGEIPDYRLA